MREEGDRIRSGSQKRRLQLRHGGDAVHVIVAEDYDSLLARCRSRQDVRGLLDPVHEKRVVKSVHRRMEKGPGLLLALDAPQHEQPGGQRREPRGAREASDSLFRESGDRPAVSHAIECEAFRGQMLSSRPERGGRLRLCRLRAHAPAISKRPIARNFR